jgi:plastocyanin
MTPDPHLDRRTILKASGVALATSNVAGCLAGGESDSGGTTTGRDEKRDDTTEHDTTERSDTAEADDETTEQETETATALDLPVEVGPGGRLEFEPSGDRPLAVEPGTSVEFVWRSDNHNVVVDAQPEGADWRGTPGGPEKFYDEGYAYSHTFEVPGTYEFHCEAHEPAGMEGTVVVRGNVPTPNFATEADLPVRVGANGNLVFSPGTDRPLKVSAGTEVRFVWESDSHNVVVDDQPKAADWRGTPGPSSEVYDAGYEYSRVFEVPGVYEFHCEPHETVGMEGTIVVTEN